MCLAQLEPLLRDLPRVEKLRLIQRLVDDLASEEGIVLGEGHAPFPVWSPHDAYQAAAVMLQALKGEGTAS